MDNCFLLGSFQGTDDWLQGLLINKNSFEVSERTTVVWWHVDSGNDASFFRDGHAPVDTEKRLKAVEPGSYTIQTKKAHGIIFAHSTIEECSEHDFRLECEGFPTPTSLRVTGLDKTFTSFGVERGRLFHMYKTGKDTAAHTALLMHGASQLSLDGFGSTMIPAWVTE